MCADTGLYEVHASFIVCDANMLRVHRPIMGAVWAEN